MEIGVASTGRDRVDEKFRVIMGGLYKDMSRDDLRKMIRAGILMLDEPEFKVLRRDVKRLQDELDAVMSVVNECDKCARRVRKLGR